MDDDDYPKNLDSPHDSDDGKPYQPRLTTKNSSNDRPLAQTQVVGMKATRQRSASNVPKLFANRDNEDEILIVDRVSNDGESDMFNRLARVDASGSILSKILQC